VEPEETMANNATLKNGVLFTPNYGDAFEKSIHGPGVYGVCTCQPPYGPGSIFGGGYVTVTQADIDEAAAVGHKTLAVS